MAEETEDKRVRRSRAALVEAAVRLVTERGTTAIPVTDLTEAADVSRKLLYLHFGDRDGLLVAATIDLTERWAATGGAQDPETRVVELARHLSEHQTFYRAVLSGSCAFAASEALKEVFGDLNRTTVSVLFGGLDEDALNDVRVFFAAGVMAIVHSWIAGPGSPADPNALADRLRRLTGIFAESFNRSDAPDEEKA
ncbi:TetR/AcrR family transcriptional regulator [Actinomadura sp. WMMB 499]|uniref:TetR/AcrR family transcriptional regulator n=1 Tax=Actinomadura sp. WMMB 499 TaxID=1219491 RepID=UPI00159EB003|nr:TetR/AcrR family transcriptional regulator [Actinomadura sp. WMMB 499]